MVLFSKTVKASINCLEGNNFVTRDGVSGRYNQPHFNGWKPILIRNKYSISKTAKASNNCLKGNNSVTRDKVSGTHKPSHKWLEAITKLTGYFFKFVNRAITPNGNFFLKSSSRYTSPNSLSALWFLKISVTRFSSMKAENPNE